MARRVSRLRVTIDPMYYPPTPDEALLRIEVVVNGEQYTYQRAVIKPDDMASIFDVLFEIAKNNIKAAILENSPGVQVDVPPATP